MLRTIIKRLLQGVAGLSVLISLTLILVRLLTWWMTRGQVYPAEQAPAEPVAVVFGAGLDRTGGPTTVLRERVETAARLYFSGKVKKLLMSGDNRFLYYNEPGAMSNYAKQLGVPAEDIVLDFAGRRTYDTCYRAGHIFGLKQVILVTQPFHLPRALFLCNQLGLQASGVPATGHWYRNGTLIVWNLRETVATFFAWLDVHFLHPEPVLGQPEPIFPLEGQ